MKLDSYWLDTAPGGLLASEGPVEGRVDVAVVGGGFTGLSAALAFGRRGASVAVLDAGRMGGGASGRNGGQCNTGVAQDYAALREQLGVERAQGCYRAYAAAVDTVERLIREERIDCDYLASGKRRYASVILPAYPTGSAEDAPANNLNVVLDPISFEGAQSCEELHMFAPLLGHEILEHYEKLHPSEAMPISRCC